MRPILLIARRELAAYLRSPLGWIVAAAVLLIDGLLFNSLVLSETRKSAEVLSQFFYISSGTTMIAAVFLSMRLIAEERQTETLTLLYSSPVREHEIVIGKFLSAFVFLALMTLATIYMPLLILVHGKIAAGQIAVGYLGLLLLGAASLAIGLFGSSLARSQVVAAVGGAGILVGMLTTWFIGTKTDRPLNEIFTWLSLHNKHFQPFMKGLLNTQDVVFYLAVTYFFLFASTRVLESRRWSS